MNFNKDLFKKVNLPKESKHYDVYYEGHGNGVYAKNYERIYLGDVWAVSEAQACNIKRYSLLTIPLLIIIFYSFIDNI